MDQDPVTVAINPIRQRHYSDEVHTVRFIWRLLVFVSVTAVLTAVLLTVFGNNLLVTLLVNFPEMTANVRALNLVVNCALLLVSSAVALLVSSWVHCLPPHLRYVTLFMGRWPRSKSGVCIILWPMETIWQVVDQRAVRFDASGIESMTRDNLAVVINAECLFRITDPVSAVFEVQSLMDVIKSLVEPSLLEFVGARQYGELQRMRESSAEELLAKVDSTLALLEREKNTKVGISIIRLRLKDIPLQNQEIVRAMAAEAEAVQQAKAIAIITEANIAQFVQTMDAIRRANPDYTPDQLTRVFIAEALKKGGHTSFLLPLDQG